VLFKVESNVKGDPNQENGKMNNHVSVVSYFLVSLFLTYVLTDSLLSVTLITI
jgi:hypothetical protein